MKLEPHYAGGNSVEFWDRVNALPEPHRWEVYGLGCALQDLEHRVLITLTACEKAAALHPRKRENFAPAAIEVSGKSGENG